MHAHASNLLLSLSLLLLGGCDLKREVVGETLPGAESSGSDTGGATDGTSSATGPVTTDDPTTGAPDGTPCELGPPESFEEGNPPDPNPDPDAPLDYNAGPIVVASTACAGEVCLYGVHTEVTTCEGDAECMGDDRLAGTCGEFGCDISQAWGEAHTTCTSKCEVDSDCPALPGCNAGPVCAPLSKLGSVCCQKVCGCRDELDQEFLDRMVEDCEKATHC